MNREVVFPVPDAGRAGLPDRRCAPFSTQEVLELLENPGLYPDKIEALFLAARREREKHFGHRVFLYGFIYTGSWCRNHCAFCFYRSGNSHALRYRKSLAGVGAAAGELARSGVHLIDLTMGEDPLLYDCGESPERAFAPLIRQVEAARAASGLPVMVSPGVIPGEVFPMLKAAGADWYACYQESHHRELFARLRPGQDYDRRWNAKLQARSAGLLLEEGILLGVGETAAGLVLSFSAMAALGPAQIRAMNFTPQPGAPLRSVPAPGAALKEPVLIALFRLMFPDALIPASLDVEGLAGLKVRLDAGANVVTSIIPPRQGLAGVAQSRLDIEEGRRSVAEVAEILEGCGLAPASPENYRFWLEQKRKS